ncbi:MAG: GyrI-like domain-containing protein [Bacteroidota bacterium]
METQKIEEFYLIGIALPFKTSNANGQSAIDCGSLWQQFEKGNYQAQIPNKLGNEVFAVYHDYEGDYTLPYAYFIGCKVDPNTPVPIGLTSLTIPSANYSKLTAKGKMPDCVANAWHRIWKSDLPRAYRPDFEIYDERSLDWSNAEVDIYLSTSH